jgi:hypothetical protein
MKRSSQECGLNLHDLGHVGSYLLYAMANTITDMLQR